MSQARAYTLATYTRHASTLCPMQIAVMAVVQSLNANSSSVDRVVS